MRGQLQKERGPYRSIYVSIWRDLDFLNLTQEERIVLLNLRTNPDSNPPCLFRFHVEDIARETLVPETVVHTVLDTLSKRDYIRIEKGYVWVKNALKFDPNIFISNPKHRELILKTIKSLPKLELIDDFLKYYSFDSTPSEKEEETASLVRREIVWLRDSGICQYCGKEILKADELEIDHVIPLSKGGSDRYDNIVCSCRYCNQKKLDRTPKEAGLPNQKPEYYHANKAIQVLINCPEILIKFNKTFGHVYHNVMGNIRVNTKKCCLPQYSNQCLQEKEKEKEKEKKESAKQPVDNSEKPEPETTTPPASPAPSKKEPKPLKKKSAADEFYTQERKEKLTDLGKRAALAFPGFNPFALFQRHKNAHPDAKIKALEELLERAGSIKDPYPYCEKIIKTESGNCFENDHACKTKGNSDVFTAILDKIGMKIQREGT